MLHFMFIFIKELEHENLWNFILSCFMSLFLLIVTPNPLKINFYSATAVKSRFFQVTNETF